MKQKPSRAGEPAQIRSVSGKKVRYYRLLEVGPDVSPDEVKQAHKDLVKVWHPDRFADDPRLQSKAQEKLKEINEAYEQVLLDLREKAARFSAQGLEPRRNATPAAVQPAWFRVPPQFPPWRAALGLGILGAVALVAFGLIFSEDIRRQEVITGPGAETSEAAAKPDDQHASGEAGPYFSLGSSQDQVLAVQGAPSVVAGNRWMYALSSVDFAQGRVEDYSNASHNLRVQLTPKGEYSAARARGYFTLGSTADEVLAVQGTPTGVEWPWWRYDASAVEFSDGKAAGYADLSRNLRVQVYPTTDVSAARARGYFTLGSSSDEVLALQGTPSSIEGSRWRYDSSLIEFSAGRVQGYSNAAGNLHVQVYPAGEAAAARARGYFVMGSSADEVLAVQGTPTTIEGDRWEYQLSWVKFRDGRVCSNSDVSGNLKFKAH